MDHKLTGRDCYTVGVISDTHGRLLSSVCEAFQQVDLIIHAGDIDSKEVLDKLQSLAPVMAVRGNMDFGAWTEQLRESETIEIGEAVLHVRHILGNIPAMAAVDVVIYGHTHQAHMERRNGILFVNPGSAGQRRYENPLSIALLCISGKEVDARIIALEE